jgi:hypothetical protein
MQKIGSPAGRARARYDEWVMPSLQLLEVLQSGLRFLVGLKCRKLTISALLRSIVGPFIREGGVAMRGAVPPAPQEFIIL